MKKILSVLCIATLLFASCSDEYDDSKLWQNVNDLKDRIASLEKTVQTMNSDIGSIQSIVDAINARDYIVKIEELADKSGYTITFAKGNTITIKHGKDGIDGKDSPIIGIDIYEGIYYWTITTNENKTWLLDNDGNKLKVSGVDGKTAYDLAVEKGYKGTLEEWLESLKGSDGQNGSDGKSAYELAVEKGYTGTLEEWLLSLNGTNGSNGKSAYELAVEKGYEGTLEEWLESLKGSNGKSAYELAVENGYSGTIEEWLESLNGTDGKDGSDGENGKDGITPILGVDSEGYWTIDMGNGVQRLKDANGEDVKAIGQDGTDGKDGVDGSSFFNNVRYDDNFVYFTFTDGKVVSIPLSKGVSFTVSNVSDRQLFVYGETRTFDIVQNNIAKISISKPDGWKVSVQGDVLTVTSPMKENTFAEDRGEIAITAMGTDSKSFIMFSFSVRVFPDGAIRFTDPNFENFCLENFDANKDGVINIPYECYTIKNIDCKNQNITKIDPEIRQFTSAETIDCSYNQLTSWYIWGTSLKEINCSHNVITKLTIDNDARLTDLNCSNNKLSSIDLSPIRSLTRLNCSSNQLTELGLDNHLDLAFLECSFNQLSELRLDQNSKLDTLACLSNQLTSLDVTNCPNLTVLSCEVNQLTSLDLSKNEKLIGLICHSNQLTSLDVSCCPNLEILNCSGNLNLSTLYLKKGQQIESLIKNDHTQIVYK